jgi:hypothetical protein
LAPRGVHGVYTLAKLCRPLTGTKYHGFARVLLGLVH